MKRNKASSPGGAYIVLLSMGLLTVPQTFTFSAGPLPGAQQSCAVSATTEPCKSQIFDLML